MKKLVQAIFAAILSFAALVTAIVTINEKLPEIVPRSMIVPLAGLRDTMLDWVSPPCNPVGSYVCTIQCQVNNGGAKVDPGQNGASFILTNDVGGTADAHWKGHKTLFVPSWSWKEHKGLMVDVRGSGVCSELDFREGDQTGSVWVRRK
jgi:hypothetical protein